ncbi:MAG: hypothetical protein JJT78_02940 [Leptospira sp.]|nr:hypothetical protein [Leptospira sp.]
MTLIKKTLLLILLSTFAIQCSSDSEVLASFDGGTVSRKELRDYFQIRGAKINEKSATIQNQSNVLEQIALQKMIYKDYLATEKVSQDFIDKLINLTKGQMLISIYKQSFEEKALRKNPMDLITMQMLILRPNSESEETSSKSQELLKKLNDTNSDSEIAAIIKENTVDANRKPIAGLIEPFCVNCGPNPYADLLEEPLKNNDKKFYLSELDGNAYLIRIVRRRGIHANVLNRYLEENFAMFEKMAKEYKNESKDPNEQNNADFYLRGTAKEKAESYGEHISRQFKNGLWQSELERIKNESSVKVENPPMLISVDNLDPKEFPDDRVLAIKADGKSIQVGTFREDFKELSEIIGRKSGGDSSKEDLWDMLNFFYNIYLSALYMEEDSKVKSLLDSDLYESSIEFLKNSLVWSLFMQEISDEKVDISETDLRDTYEAGKMFAYSKPDPNDKQKRIPLPYSQVRTKILSELENQKRKSIFDSKINLLKTDRQLKIAKDSLKEGKI